MGGGKRGQKELKINTIYPFLCFWYKNFSQLRWHGIGYNIHRAWSSFAAHNILGNSRFMVPGSRYNIFLAFQEKNQQRMLDSCPMYIRPGLVFSSGNWEAIKEASDIRKMLCYSTSSAVYKSSIWWLMVIPWLIRLLQMPEEMLLHVPNIRLLHWQGRRLVFWVCFAKLSCWVSYWWDLTL